MTHRRVLVPHPTSAVSGLTLQAQAERRSGSLSLEFRLSGPVETVRWPEPAPRLPTDGLWGTTCFEAFVAAEGGGYLEYNLSPSGAWAAYRFEGYRQGQRPFDAPTPPAMLRHAPGLAVLTADVALPDDAVGLVGLTAVIETLGGDIAYWALAHPSDKPDFHHPDSFILDLR